MSIPKCLDFSNYNKYSTDANPTTNADMQIFMQNQNDIVSALSSTVWQPLTSYVANQVIRSDSMPAGIVAVVKNAGQSASTEPTWKSSGTVSDGNVVWTMRSLVNDIDGKVAISQGASNVDKVLKVDANGNLVLVKDGGGHKIVETLPTVANADDNVVYFTVDNLSLPPQDVNVGEAITQLQNDIAQIQVIETGADYVVASGHSADNTQWYRKWKSGWLEQGGKVSANSEQDVTITLLKSYANNDYDIHSSTMGFENGTISNTMNTMEATVFNVTKTTFTVRLAGSTNRRKRSWYACGQGGND